MTSAVQAIVSKCVSEIGRIQLANPSTILALAGGAFLLSGVVGRLFRRKKNVRGQIVVITGAGSGLGRLFTHRFAALGAKVACLDINQKGIDETIAGVKKAYGEGCVLKGYVCDVSKKDNVDSVMTSIVKDLGPIDILLNNAGIVVGKRAEDLTERDMRKTVDVNLLGPMFCTTAVLKSMIDRNKGHLVYLCSAAGLHGVARLTDYCGSKAGTIIYADAVHEEMRGRGYRGIKVSIINPYFINTGMFIGVRPCPPLCPLLEPSWVVSKAMDAILYEQYTMGLPFMVKITPIIKACMPLWFQQGLSDLFHIGTSMDAFDPSQRATK